MSGGVDSSVAALLMREEGYTCLGCTMRLFSNEEAGVTNEKGCCSLADVEDARSVAYRLGMPYYVFNFCDDFKKTVLQDFVDNYTAGKTPNPCIECNRSLKFAKLLERANVLGCEVLVTGHYARVTYENGHWSLKKAWDAAKDQSYVLYMLTQEQLSHIRFPLGNKTKQQVRAIAQQHGFLNAAKRESQDLCFVPDGDYPAAIRRLTGRVSVPGDFVDETGRVLGRHKGIEYYTIGQRKGLGVSGSMLKRGSCQGAAGKPLYVVAIDSEKNTITLGTQEALFASGALLQNVNWIQGDKPSGQVRCAAKVRYRQAEQPACVTPLDENSARLVFSKPQRAITPGQAAVFYDGDTVLGGGTIAEVLR